MPINFPDAPINGQVYTANGSTWSYSTTVGAWLSSSTTVNSPGVFPGDLKITNSLGVGVDAPGTAGTIRANNIVDSLGNVRDVPLNEQTSAYVLQSSDQGKIVSITTGGITVPNAVFSAGDNISIYNASFSNQTIVAAGSVTMYLVGTANTSSRTLAQRGLATVVCVAANTFVITGGGLT